MSKEQLHSHGSTPFGEAGIPHTYCDHTHEDEHGHVIAHNHNHASGVNDYMQAVAEYRKTFASKQDVLEQTPDPAVREMLLRMEQLGFDTTFDRFDKQKPQCSFGLAGVCCKICNMGPCKVTPKSPRGVCGADADLIVARNLLRMAAAGTAQHGAHARELILELKYAAEGKLNVPIVGEETVLATAQKFGIETEGRTINAIASDIADILLEDLSRALPEEYKTIQCCAPPERQKVWKEMDILPISAYHEVFEAYHRTGCGTDGDWQNVMQQMLRCGLAFVFTGVLATNIATDCLFGYGHPTTTMVNIGALKKGYVNIAVHGHLPLLVNQIIEAAHEEKYIQMAKDAGAEGIQFYGICCSGLSGMYRYEGVIPLANAVGAELVLGTGALDLWVADVQDVFPSIMDVARCFQTTVVTTSDTARLPGAEHYAFDHHHSNIADARNIGRQIVERAIRSYRERQGQPVFIPPYEVKADVGLSVEALQHKFGSLEPIAEALKNGTIRGIVNLVGCNNPRVVYERAIVDVADILLENNMIVLTNGCASFPLLKMGYCHYETIEGKLGEGIKTFLKGELPPVWHFGECIDNARASGLFGALAGICGHRITDMPYAMTSPEWGNEKGLDAALGFRLMGINSYHCVEAPIHGSDNVKNFIKTGTKEQLGSTMTVIIDPQELGHKIVADIEAKRKALGWD